MSDNYQPNDALDFAEGEKPSLPTFLNVLTILTIIWSIISILMAFWTYFTIDKSYKQLVESKDKMENAPAWVKGMMTPEMIEASRKQMENKLPVMLLTLIGAALCLYGAIEMRKLKKQGFLLWVIGEFLPILATVIFIGAGMMFSGFAVFFMIFPLAFLIMYAVNKKYLVY